MNGVGKRIDCGGDCDSKDWMENVVCCDQFDWILIDDLLLTLCARNTQQRGMEKTTI